MIAYKVVHIRCTKFISSNAEKITDACTVVYIPKRWVKPKKGNGPLCLFANSEDALRWGNIKRAYKIFEVEYVPSSYDKVWYFFGEVRIECSVTKLAQLTQSPIILAEQVKLIKEIRYEKEKQNIED